MYIYIYFRVRYVHSISQVLSRILFCLSLPCIPLCLNKVARPETNHSEIPCLFVPVQHIQTPSRVQDNNCSCLWVIIKWTLNIRLWSFEKPFTTRVNLSSVKRDLRAACGCLSQEVLCGDSKLMKARLPHLIPIVNNCITLCPKQRLIFTPSKSRAVSSLRHSIYSVALCLAENYRRAISLVTHWGRRSGGSPPHS